MGVTGLWTVVQPCARPIKIETLNKKRLAVDASIWIYQFLKAVRDKEGNALRNSHVVGFFRRICKLLFVGILPVFVFDGGAPVLKRQTISARKSRREGRKEDAVRTAGKLLALQMQRAAEDDERKRKDEQQRGPAVDEEELPENLVYADEVQMTQQERQQNRRFKKKDQYHLPELDASFAEMGQPNDPRIMSIEELETYARQFDTGEDINVYDFSKIDFDSPFFVSLPASDRYNILNAARLRSRLRMGYSKEQLESMFPDRMAFSKFQIERVTERNELTQRLMNLNGMNDDVMFGIGGQNRVAGERGREYVLVKNDGVEGGWALGVVTNKDEGKKSKPIDVDELSMQMKMEGEEEVDDEEDFEDVPIEGLNRLPKKSQSVRAGEDRLQQTIARKRKAFYAKRKGTKPRKRRPAAVSGEDDPDSLFMANEPNEIAEEDEEDEDIDIDGESNDDEELNRAIAMSLQQEGDGSDGEQDLDQTVANSMEDGERDNEYLDLFEQKRVEEARPLPRGSGKAIAHIYNNRAAGIVPAAAPATGGDSEDDDMDLQSALAESRNSRHRPKSPVRRPRSAAKSPAPATNSQLPVTKAPQKASGFDGPLPFEKLDLGSSLLGKKKMQDLQQSAEGGFQKESDKKKDDAQPLPPWFAGNLDDGIAAQKQIEKTDREKAKEFSKQYEFSEPSVLRRQATQEVIDLEDVEEPSKDNDVFVIDESESEAEGEQMPVRADDDDDDDVQISMGDMADAIRGAPPEPTLAADNADEPVIQLDRPDETQERPKRSHEAKREKPVARKEVINDITADKPINQDEDEEEQIDWSDSDTEAPAKQQKETIPEPEQNQPGEAIAPPKSPSPEFEDVDIPDEVPPPRETERMDPDPVVRDKDHVSGAVDQNAPVNDEAEEFGYYSDSEDEELMRQLATEAEEHARFASTLNHKSQQQNVQDYEKELKQLRSQQKKDRRDADEVTQIMITECQQLLKLFGLPYITAPMEAEAQCAELVHLGLVDGIVTDDSDCFLFGGTRIYKNMFNQAKFVECYLASDLEKEFDLTRDKLISIAQLLGSDYTEGLSGVGPVTALEILSEFPSLTAFKDWWTAVQMNTIPKSVDVGNPFKKKFRRNATKLFLPPAFPDRRVDAAYATPEVDSDPSPFQWGVPDLDALRRFLMATIGWSEERTDEVLVPVIRDMNQRLSEGTQSNITAFFSGGSGAGAYAPRKRLEMGSKRIGSALDRMSRQAKRKRSGAGVEEEGIGEVQDSEEVAVEEQPKKTKKRKARKAKKNVDTPEEDE